MTIELAQLAARITAAASRPPFAPATFLGIQPGCGVRSDFALYNLTEAVGQYCIGSTVSEQTLINFGFRLPDAR
jgi:hypothetical protein